MKTEEKQIDDYTFNFDTMSKDARIIKIHQEGNYLYGLTDKGVKFSQRIPQGKILDKVNGEYILKDVVVA